jgi:DNA polymerase-1
MKDDFFVEEKEEKTKKKSKTGEKEKVIIPEYTKVFFNDFDFLESIQDDDVVVIDIETTGLKPHRKGHRIVCISMTVDNETVVFNEFSEKLHEILKNKKIKKIAHNLSFESMWIKVIWGYWVQNWHWDTMICNHILDNVASSGLKNLVKDKFKVEDYDINVKKYLEGDGSNEFNRIDELPIKEVMTYCGYDTYFTRKLWLLQRRQIYKDKHLQKGLSFFMEGIKALSNVQNNGICFDYVKLQENEKELIRKIELLDQSIKNSKEVSKLEDKKTFNYNSTKQLRHLFFDVLKIESVKKTVKGFESVDVDVLTKINTEFTKNILEHRHLSKIKETYLSQFSREAVQLGDECFIYPFFSLGTTVTYRSSSSNPNFQNIPIRDEYAKLMARSCIIPRKEGRLLEIDFKGMEVAIGCCYHKDMNMINYVTDKRNNMHTDTAALIFMMDKSEVSKDVRFCAKNGFVFPSFYGSTSRMYNDELKEQGYGELTFNLWEMLDYNTKEHLKDKKIKNIFQFQKHIEKVEEYFWGELFPDYQQWKFDNWNQYKERGYIELFTGFRCTGKMGFNQVNNYRIQGTAFHVMLWCLIKINEILKIRKMKSMIIGQIHDSIIFDIVDEELEELKKIIKYICTIAVREHFKWIIVPLEIEAEITGINESWNLKKGFIL